MFTITDQLNRKVVTANYPPKRIISLVPSQTELLHDLGLEEEVIGITKFCVHPQNWFRNKTRIGGTKNVDIEKVKELNPDLILANKEENVKEQIEALEDIAPVWVSDVNNLGDALDMIESVGSLTGKQKNARELISKIESGFSQFPSPPRGEGLEVRACYFIWHNPYMTIGGDTFINDMLKRCGLQNVYQDQQRYPVITLQELKERNVPLILLSSEPYPFKEKHMNEIRMVLPGTKILMVDGEMFSWYGSRLLYAAQYFKELINKIYDPISPTRNLT
jgi:ABC-type Fe3+-hydroxamate transport system substrate-binding protein